MYSSPDDAVKELQDKLDKMIEITRNLKIGDHQGYERALDALKTKLRTFSDLKFNAQLNSVITSRNVTTTESSASTEGDFKSERRDIGTNNITTLQKDFEVLADVRAYEINARMIHDKIGTATDKSRLYAYEKCLRIYKDIIAFASNAYALCLAKYTTGIQQGISFEFDNLNDNLTQFKTNYSNLDVTYNDLNRLLDAKQAAEQKLFEKTKGKLPSLYENLARLVAANAPAAGDTKESEAQPSLLPIDQAIVIFNKYATDRKFRWHHHRERALELVKELFKIKGDEHILSIDRVARAKGHLESMRNLYYADDVLKVDDKTEMPSSFLHAMHYVIETVFNPEAQQTLGLGNGDKHKGMQLNSQSEQ